MDKEKVITVIIGVVLGIIIAGGLFVYLKYVAPTTDSGSTTQQTPLTNSATQENLTLNITAPEDNLITKDKTVEIKGMGPANVRLLVFSSVEEKMLITDNMGNFTGTVKLEEGENKISVFYSGPDQQLISVSRVVIVEI